MDFAPMNKMWEKVEGAREDSDRALFDVLLEFCEMTLKTVVLGMVAAIDDLKRDQYRQLYRLVRADGLGEWERVLEEILTGPASQSLFGEAQAESRELTMRSPERTWQYSAVADMHNALLLLVPETALLQTKVAGKQWITLFVQVRNKSRGHGALPLSLKSQLCVHLESSLRTFLGGFSLFQRPWAYLYRNMSGRYRVTRIGGDVSGLDWLKSAKAVSENYSVPNGVYIDLGRLVQVPLLASDVEGFDYFHPNGAATSKRFELLSYITGTVHQTDMAPFITPPTELPRSETGALKALVEEGRCFSTVPPLQQDYITRERLEHELCTILSDDRHPVVTLVGRGGIGKTSLALSVLHKLSQETRFGLILWFSARDIDLLPQGPKRVQPDVQTVEEVAKEFVHQLQAVEPNRPKSDIEFFSQALTHSPYGNLPILFVFDNFETVRAPQDLYAWIDQHVRLPNKVLITTRSRDFKGDYPVEVSGMSEEESDKLIDSTITQLEITTLLDDAYRHMLYQESNGHPYVIKVLLGEVKKVGQAIKVERIVASQDEMLNALFERTYNALSPVAQRLFLSLSSWRSAVPQLAIEAVLLRPQNERMDVERAVNELKQSSLIDLSISEDDSTFLVMPLVTSVFGKRKLAVSPWKGAIEQDRNVLLSWGVTNPLDIQKGIAPRIEQMFRTYAEHIRKSPDKLDEFMPVMEFVARKYPFAWLYIAEILKEDGRPGSIERAKICITGFLEFAETPDDQRKGWRTLAAFCRDDADLDGEAHAILEYCLVSGTSMTDISTMVNRLNDLRKMEYKIDDSEEIGTLARQVAAIMTSRIDEASATDCSRLAWLHLHLHDEISARRVAEQGLRLDPENDYCIRLARRLGISY